jgi:hypothetical protein
MSQANLESLGYAVEVTENVIPAVDKKLLRFTSHQLNANYEVTQSNNVEASTNRSGQVQTAQVFGGSIGIEFNYGEYDTFIEAALRGTFATAINITGTTISAAAADNSFNDSGSGFGSIAVGQWLRVTGFATAANNGWFKVVTRTTSKITVQGSTLVNESAGPSVNLRGAICANATTSKSFAFERHHTDLTNNFENFTGGKLNEFSLSFPTGDIVTGSMSFICRGGTPATTTAFTGTTAADATDSFNTVGNLRRIFINGVPTTNDLTGLELNISTNSERLAKIGSAFAAGVNQGSISVSGNLTEYFEDNTLKDLAKANTPFDLAFVLEDGDGVTRGNGYVFHLPRVRLAGADNPNQGINTVTTANYTFNAEKDPTLQRTISVNRWTA